MASEIAKARDWFPQVKEFFFDDDTLTDDEANAFRARCKEFLDANEFPLVEGRNVTFVYQGHASDVELVHWIHGLESAQNFQRMHGTNLWYLLLDLPAQVPA